MVFSFLSMDPYLYFLWSETVLGSKNRDGIKLGEKNCLRIFPTETRADPMASASASASAASGTFRNCIGIVEFWVMCFGLSIVGFEIEFSYFQWNGKITNNMLISLR